MKPVLTLLAFIICSTSVFSQNMPTYSRKINHPKKRGALINRYQYVGNVPRFQGRDLELFLSKMMLTLRVKAWVRPALVAGYQKEMLDRWNRIHTDLETTSMELIPLRNPKEVTAEISKPGLKHWAELVETYMPHVLENQGVSIYNESNGTVMSLAILRYLMQNSSLTIEDGKALLAKPANELASKILFSQHLNHLFTPDTSRPDYIGYLTFVYPIADHHNGPFDWPEPKTYQVGTTFSKELYFKDFSYTKNEFDKFLGDVFGGFPFLIYIPGRAPKWENQCDASGNCQMVMTDPGDKGTALHGPVDDATALNDIYDDELGSYTGAWYLRRAHVSHGCNRMDGNDVMELATMLPDLTKQKAPITVDNWPDVYFDQNDGKLVVADVDYYGLPTTKNASVNDSLEKQKSNFFTKTVAPSLRRSPTPSKASFDPSTLTWKDLTIRSEELQKVNGPVYDIPIKTQGTRGVRLIEYKNGPSPIEQFVDPRKVSP